MTSLNQIYKAFLNKIEEDDWDDMSQLENYQAHWKEYLNSAIGFFKFPRVSLELDSETGDFSDNLGNEEIQILADYMKVEWLQSNILTWEKIKTDYHESDFSQANLLDKLDKTLHSTISRAERRERNYYRSINGKPFNYSKLAGDDRYE